MKNETKPPETAPLVCAGCGKPIVSKPGGLDQAKIAKGLGSDEVYHGDCHPKGRMVMGMGLIQPRR